MSEFQSHGDNDNRIKAPYGNTPLTESQSLEIIRSIHDTKVPKTTRDALADAAKQVARYTDSSKHFARSDDHIETTPFYYGSVVGYHLSTVTAPNDPIMNAAAQKRQRESIINYNHMLMTLPLRHRQTFNTRQSGGDYVPTAGESIRDIGRQAFADLLCESNDVPLITNGLGLRGNDLGLFNDGAGYALHAAHQTEETNKEIKSLTRPSTIADFEDGDIPNTIDNFITIIRHNYPPQ